MFSKVEKLEDLEKLETTTHKRFLKITDLETKSVYYYYQKNIFNISKYKPFYDDKEFISIESTEGKNIQFEVSKVKIEETDTMNDIITENNRED